MNVIPFDTLAFALKLQAGGFPRGQAEVLSAALAEVLACWIDGRAAAGADGATVAALRAEVAALRAELRGMPGRPVARIGSSAV